jgi:hypothetical protein
MRIKEGAEAADPILTIRGQYYRRVADRIDVGNDNRVPGCTRTAQDKLI